MKKNTVIFDLDGTLLNTIEDLTDSVNYVMKIYGFPQWDISDIRRFVGNGIRRLMISATPQGEENPQFEEIYECFRDYYETHCHIKTRAYYGIMKLLEILYSQGYKMAIVSNKVDLAVQELNDMYFKKYISVAIGDREGFQKKPAPDSVNEALRILHSTKEEAIYVGDSEVDAQTAINADLDYVLVTWGFRDEEQMKQYARKTFIDRPVELLDILKEYM